MDDATRLEWEREQAGGSVHKETVRWTRKSGELIQEVRWVAQFRARDYTGKIVKYRDRKSTTKKGAQKALAALKRRALVAKEPPRPPELEAQSVGDWLDTWHKRRVDQARIRTNTQRNEARQIELVKGLIGVRRLRSLRPEDVETLLEHLQTEKLKGKARTIQQIYRMLAKAFRDVRPRLRPNPCDGVASPTVGKPDTRTYSPDELRSILAAVDRPRKGDTVVDDVFCTLVHFLAGTGARVGEALALVWGDIDLIDGMVRIRKTLIDVPKAGLKRMDPKTRSAVRNVPLEPGLLDRLRRLRAMGGAIPHKRKPVFASEAGGWLRLSNVLRRRWHPLLKEVELDTCGFHRLRHTFASLALRQCVDVVTVSRLLGHASPAITLSVYANHVPGREREATGAIAALISREEALKS